MKALRTNGDLLPEYLLLVLKSISPVLLSKVKESSHGTKRLDTDDLKNVEIPVPPINDQKRLIAEYQNQSDTKERKLEDLRTLEEKLTELESSIGEHHKAQLMSLISGGIQDRHK